MADGTTSPDLKDQPKVQDTLFFNQMAKNAEMQNLMRQKAVKELIQKGTELYQVKVDTQKNAGEEVFERVRPERMKTLLPAELQDMKLQFGGGRAFIEEDDPENIQFDTDDLSLTQENLVKSSSKEADKAIDTVSSFLTYSNVLQEANKPGKKLADVLAKHKPHLTQTEYTRMRTAALSGILDHESIKELLPDLQKLSRDAQEKLLEEFLIKDPKLRQKVANRMYEARGKALGLKGIEQDEKYDEAVANRDQADEKIDHAVNSVVDQLEAEHLPLGNADDLKHYIQQRIQEGASVERVMYEAKRRMISTDPDFQTLINYNNLQIQLQAAEKALNEVNKKTAPDASIANLENNVNDLKQKLKDSQDVVDKIIGVDEKIDNINRILTSTNTEKSGNEYVNPFARELNNAVQAKQDKEKAIKLITKTESDTKLQAKKNRALNSRLQEESDLTDEINDILANASIDVLQERFQQMTEAQEAKILQDAQKAEEEGDKAKADALRNLNERIKTRWRTETNEQNRKKPEPKKLQIKKDLLYALYHGDKDDNGRNIGIQRLMLQDMGLKDEAGNVITNPENLSDEQKKLFETVYDTKNEEYTKRLLSEYFMIRGKKGMGLKEHELLLLNEHYGRFIDETINKSGDAQRVLAELAAKGIKVESSDVNAKWLLFIIAILGTAAFGLMTAGGIGLAGVGAAKGIGAVAGLGKLATLSGSVGTAVGAAGSTLAGIDIANSKKNS